jgi:hypothetical protein
MKLSADGQSDAVPSSLMLSRTRQKFLLHQYPRRQSYCTPRKTRKAFGDRHGQQICSDANRNWQSWWHAADSPPKMDVHETAMLMEGVDLIDRSHVSPTRQECGAKEPVTGSSHSRLSNSFATDKT